LPQVAAKSERTLRFGCKLGRQQMESKEEETKVSKMTGDVATGCGQIGKDNAIWLQACATTNEVEKRIKVSKMTGDVATGCGQIGKNIAIWLQAWATTNGVERRRNKKLVR